ncbi:MAG: 16S rRNA (adenine(1518)-N(6)/adenine(1519)-N(6))-dimethyltransferase RsmA [Bacteroidia bacterium]
MHNLKPKKHLGQHFLTDPGYAKRIVDMLKAPEDAPVFEIGPGQGVLTEFLIQQYSRLALIEVDPDAVQWLRSHFAKQNPQIIHTDVLKWNMEEDIDAPAYLIGNLPYNISSPIFFQILENRNLVKEGVFMIQKEVAERIAADPGSKTYGILSVLLGVYFDIEYGFSVPPSVFRPPPKVVSGVIRITRRDEEEVVPFRNLKIVVKTAFNQRRKTLRNALKSLDFQDFLQKEEMLKMRAEQLSKEDFLVLAQNVIM